MPEDFDVCVSYSRHDIDYVEKVVAALEAANVRVFYDKNEEAALWGSNLRRKLASIYQKARFCVVFLSAAYQESVWTQYELGHAGMRALHEDSLLPVRLDDAEVPLELSTIIWIDGRDRPPETIADLIVHKVHSGDVQPRPPRPFLQKLKDYVRYRIWRFAAVVALLIALGVSLLWLTRPSSTDVRFDHGTPHTLVVRVENSGGRSSELIDARLRFHGQPLKNADLVMVQKENRAIEPNGGWRNFRPSKLELEPTVRFENERELLEQLRGDVTLEYQVRESDEAEGSWRTERVPVGRIQSFIEKWVPDER